MPTQSILPDSRSDTIFENLAAAGTRLNPIGPDIYITDYPEHRKKIAVTTDGGLNPVWSGDGNYLYFTYGQKIYKVNINAASELSTGQFEEVFNAEGNFLTAQNLQNLLYDVSNDDKQLLMVRQEPEVLYSIILNWFEEINRIDPANK